MTASPLTSFEERYKIATERHQAGDLLGAEEVYKEILAKDADHAPSLHMRAMLDFQKGDKEKALKGLEKALSLGHKTAMVWWHYGYVLLSLAKPKEAVFAFEAALLEKPGDQDLLFNLGIAAEEADLPDKALPALKEAASKMNTAAAFYRLGLALQRFGQKSASMKAYVRALEREPNFADAALNAGVLAHETGDFPYATNLYSQALKAKPDLSKAALNLGVAFQDQGDPLKAVAIFRAFLEKDPNSLDAFNNLGVALQRLGDHVTAMEAYHEVLKRDPFHKTAIENLATALRRLGKDGSILDYPKLLTKNWPEKKEAWIILGRALEREALYDEALVAFKAALKCDPAYAPTHDLLGTVEQHRKDLNAAFGYYKTAVTLSPHDMEYKVNLGLAALRTQKPEIALSSFDFVLDRNPFDQRAIAYKALALRLLGDATAADWLTDPSSVATIFQLETPDGYKDLSDFLALLATDLRNISARTYAPYGQSVRGGTQTENMLFGEKALSIVAFRRTLDQALKAYIEKRPKDDKHPYWAARPDRLQYRSWSVILRKGGHHIPHIHPGGCISGVFYVEVPKLLGNEGWLELGRPGISMTLETPPLRLIKPEPGLLVLFPSYLWHGTLPFTGDGERITIAFDVIQTEAEPLPV